MNAVLGIDFYQEMNVFRHNLQFKDFGIQFCTGALYNIFKPGINPIDQYRSSIFRTPDNVIFTGVHHVVIRFITDGVL